MRFVLLRAAQAQQLCQGRHYAKRPKDSRVRQTPASSPFWRKPLLRPEAVAYLLTTRQAGPGDIGGVAAGKDREVTYRQYKNVAIRTT
jgi:hypothetical protein